MAGRDLGNDGAAVASSAFWYTVGDPYLATPGGTQLLVTPIWFTVRDGIDQRSPGSTASLSARPNRFTSVGEHSLNK